MLLQYVADMNIFNNRNKRVTISQVGNRLAVIFFYPVELLHSLSPRAFNNNILQNIYLSLISTVHNVFEVGTDFRRSSKRKIDKFSICTTQSPAQNYMYLQKRVTVQQPLYIFIFSYGPQLYVSVCSRSLTHISY